MPQSIMEVITTINNDSFILNAILSVRKSNTGVSGRATLHSIYGEHRLARSAARPSSEHMSVYRALRVACLLRQEVHGVRLVWQHGSRSPQAKSSCIPLIPDAK